MIDIRKVKPSTVVTAVSMLVVTINAVLGIFGISPVPEDDTVQIVVACISAVVIGVSFWKNQNWTVAAIEAQKYLDESRKEDNE